MICQPYFLTKTLKDLKENNWMNNPQDAYINYGQAPSQSQQAMQMSAYASQMQMTNYQKNMQTMQMQGMQMNRQMGQFQGMQFPGMSTMQNQMGPAMNQMAMNAMTQNLMQQQPFVYQAQAQRGQYGNYLPQMMQQQQAQQQAQQAQQQHMKKRKNSTQKHSTIPPQPAIQPQPQIPISHMATVPQPQHPMPFQEPKLKFLLEKITDEKMDVVLSLFECNSAKKKEEKLDALFNLVMNKFNPLFVSSMCSFLEHLIQDPNEYLKFKNLNIPICFTKMKGCKQIFKNLNLTEMPFEVQLNKNAKKSVVLGSFICALESISPKQYEVFVDGNKAKFLYYGENEGFFLLSDSMKPNNHISITISGQMPQTFLCWFVIQFVEKRTPDDVVNYLMSSSMKTVPSNLKIQIAQTPHCKGCRFNARHAVEEIINNGAAYCPKCGENILLKEMIFGEKAQAPTQSIKIEEDPDMQRARMICAEHLCNVLKPSHTEQDWEDILFDSAGIPPEEYIPLHYTNTDEFRKELCQLFK